MKLSLAQFSVGPSAGRLALPTRRQTARFICKNAATGGDASEKPKAKRRSSKAVKKSEQPSIAAATSPAATLLKKTKAELQEIATSLGLPKSGTKAQLTERIILAEAELDSSAGAAKQEETADMPIADKVKKKSKTGTRRTRNTSKAMVEKKPKSSREEISAASADEARSAEIEESIPLAAEILEQSDPLPEHDEAQQQEEFILSSINSLKSTVEPDKDPVRVENSIEDEKKEATAVGAEEASEQKQSDLNTNGAITYLRINQEVEDDSNSVSDFNTNATDPLQSPELATSSYSAPSPLPPKTFRRKLTPDEASKILEELVRRKGTGGIGLSIGNTVSSASDSAFFELDAMKSNMAELKARLNAQERNTEQLLAVIERGAASTQFPVKNEGLVPDKSTTPQSPTSFSCNAVEESALDTNDDEVQPSLFPPPPSSTDLQNAVELAAAVGQAAMTMGRGLLNAFIKRSKE